MTNICLDCPAEIGAKSKRCRPCSARLHNADPAMRERRLAGIRKAMQDPVKRAEAAERLNVRISAWRATPEGKARLSELGREFHRKSMTPEARAKRKAVAAAAGAKKTQTTLGWCPLEWRKRYKSLRAFHGAAKAKTKVLAEIAAREAEADAALTPFEKVLRAVERGATVVVRQPITRSYEMTLGGVASGMIA